MNSPHFLRVILSRSDVCFCTLNNRQFERDCYFFSGDSLRSNSGCCIAVRSGAFPPFCISPIRRLSSANGSSVGGMGVVGVLVCCGEPSPVCGCLAGGTVVGDGWFDGLGFSSLIRVLLHYYGILLPYYLEE